MCVRARVHACVEIEVYVPTTLPQGVGRRYANLVCKKADVDMSKRAGELTEEEVESTTAVVRQCWTGRVMIW